MLVSPILNNQTGYFLFLLVPAFARTQCHRRIPFGPITTRSCSAGLASPRGLSRRRAIEARFLAAVLLVLVVGLSWKDFHSVSTYVNDPHRVILKRFWLDNLRANS